MKSEQRIEERKLVGRVVRGRGVARTHLQDEAEDFHRATGQNLFPGSLNVILQAPLFLNLKEARFTRSRVRLLWPATLFDLPVWIYRFPHSPLHVVELLSPDHLRSRFALADGDPVVLRVRETLCVDLSLRQRAAWTLLWKGRESWSYSRDTYYFKTRQLAIDLGATQREVSKGLRRSLFDFIRRHKT